MDLPVKLIILIIILSMSAFVCSISFASPEDKAIMLDMLNSSIHEKSKELKFDKYEIKPGNEIDMIGNPEDRELSVPDDWKDYGGIGDNPDGWFWEDDENIPEDEFDIPSKPYDIEGEGTTGEDGYDWELPKWHDAELPFTDDDLNMPDFPFEGQFTNEGFAPDFEEDD